MSHRTDTPRWLDAVGWPLLPGSYVRVEPPGLPSYHGWVEALTDAVRLRDEGGRLRSALPGSCIVVRPSERARIRRQHFEASGVHPARRRETL